MTEHIDEKHIKYVLKDFRSNGELVQVQQTLFRMVEWLGNLMGHDKARNWLSSLAYPEPIQDWETGHERGDICPKHGKELSGMSCNSHTELQCIDHTNTNRCLR